MRELLLMHGGETGQLDALAETLSTADQAGFLKVPPFPGSKPALFASAGGRADMDDAEVDRIVERLAELRVGGTCWGAQPEVPEIPYVLVHVRGREARAKALLQLPQGQATVSTETLPAPFDPWHVVRGASTAIVDADDELALIATAAGVPVRPVGEGRFRQLAGGNRSALRDAFRPLLVQRFTSPFGEEVLDFAEAAELCGFWRRLIDSNRDISAAVGFAHWKRETVAPLLWAGSEVPFRSSVPDAKPGDHVAVWKTRTDADVLARLERSGAELIEVEDGFIRSAGLGADCVPPLSIIVDRAGVYFDPSRSSDLERILENGPFPPDLLERARELRQVIVESGLSKYGSGGTSAHQRPPNRRKILVPGQVEDDRSVMTGGAGLTNFELLRRVRAAAPDAYILYKPHPDIEAGHRKGRIEERECLALADEIVRTESISAVLEVVDEVHVNTSLAGFEALLREKPVTTYGVPFYAGWGLTSDLGPVPPRRTARRSLDELTAGALLLYPRYLDPVTKLPCPPEILVNRLSQLDYPRSGALIMLRRLQGQLKRRVAAVREMVSR
jgi:capsular polysaccharide export protein